MNLLLIILWLTLKPPGLWLGKPDEAKAIVNTNCALGETSSRDGKDVGKGSPLRTHFI